MSGPVNLGTQRRKRDADEHGNSRWTVRDMLVDALEEIDSGKKDPKRAVLILVLDEDDSDCHRIMRLANIRYSEAICALDIEKARMLQEMI